MVGSDALPVTDHVLNESPLEDFSRVGGSAIFQATKH